MRPPSARSEAIVEEDLPEPFVTLQTAQSPPADFAQILVKLDHFPKIGWKIKNI